VDGKVVLELSGLNQLLLPVVVGRMGQEGVDIGEQGGIKDRMVEVETKEIWIKEATRLK
jgi:hypothetical protein